MFCNALCLCHHGVKAGAVDVQVCPALRASSVGWLDLVWAKVLGLTEVAGQLGRTPGSCTDLCFQGGWEV